VPVYLSGHCSTTTVSRRQDGEVQRILSNVMSGQHSDGIGVGGWVGTVVSDADCVGKYVGEEEGNFVGP